MESCAMLDRQQKQNAPTARGFIKWNEQHCDVKGWAVGKVW